MKNYLSFLLLFLGNLPLYTGESQTLLLPQSSLIEANISLSDEDELKIIQRLIDGTTAQLEIQKQLKGMMLDFKNLREEFTQGNQTKSHTGRMVRMARQIYEVITAHHLEHLFAKDYLEELSFFSSIAGKTAISRP